MKLSNLEIKNFKSFKHTNIKFGDFNVIIGSNASGKSNLVDILKFLKDIETWGLESAISLQGGRDYLLNLHLGRKESLYCKIRLDERDSKAHRMLGNELKGIGITFTSIEVEFEIKFFSRREGYSIEKNIMTFYYDLEEVDDTDDKWKVEKKLGNFPITLEVKKRKSKKKVDITLGTPKELNLVEEDFAPFDFIIKRLDNKKLLLEQPFIFFFTPYASELLNKFSVFDFSPKIIKTSSPVAGKVQLESDASNLPVVLKLILKDKNKRDRLVNLVSDLLPFVQDFKVTETSDKALILEIKEKYYKNKYLPSTFLSDGTAHATALITALYFDDSSIVVFEEPERNLHPELVRKAIEHMKSESKNKQVFVTTHNTELLRVIDPNDILFISRCDEGFSKIVHMSEKKEIEHFLANEIGIDELYANNILNGL